MSDGCGGQIGPYECCTVVTGDARDLTKAIPDGLIDVVITDPPFGTGTAAWDVEPEPETWHQIRRAGQDRFAVFGYAKQLMKWSRHFEDLTLAAFVVWVKYNELIPSPGLTRAHQDIAIWARSQTQLRADVVREPYSAPRSLDKFRSRGGGELADRLAAGAPSFDRARGRRCTDVWAMPAPGRGFNAHLRNHRNEKPLAALDRLVKLLCRPEEIVWDPHCGSGTTLVGAKRNGTHYLGFELQPGVADGARARLRITQPPLFVIEPELQT